VMLEELMKRVPELTRLGPSVPLRSNNIHGLKHVPVRLSERKVVQ